MQLETFSGHGVRFEYPGCWEVEEQTVDDGVTLSIATGDTSFWSLTLLRDRPQVSNVLDTALQAFEDEYDQVEATPVSADIHGRTASGFDLEFVALELINSAAVRAFRTGRFTAFVLYQGFDREFEDLRAHLEAITASVQSESDDDILII